MRGVGRGGCREGRDEIRIVDTLTSWLSHSPKILRTCVVKPDLGLFLSPSFSFSVSWPQGFLGTKIFQSPTPLKSQRR